jgi:hypothetical protein
MTAGGGPAGPSPRALSNKAEDHEAGGATRQQPHQLANLGRVVVSDNLLGLGSALPARSLRRDRPWFSAKRETRVCIRWCARISGPNDARDSTDGSKWWVRVLGYATWVASCS